MTLGQSCQLSCHQAPALLQAQLLMLGARLRIPVTGDDPVQGTLCVICEGDLSRDRDGHGSGGPEAAVYGIGKHQSFPLINNEESCVHVWNERRTVLAQGSDEAAPGMRCERLHPARVRLGNPPLLEEFRRCPSTPNGGPGRTNDPLDHEVKILIHDSP